jgi:hypothetical protein
MVNTTIVGVILFANKSPLYIKYSSSIIQNIRKLQILSTVRGASGWCMEPRVSLKLVGKNKLQVTNPKFRIFKHVGIPSCGMIQCH